MNPNNQSNVPDGYGSSIYGSDRNSELLAKLQQLPRWNCRFSGTVMDSKNQSLNEYIASIRNFMETVELSSRDMMRHIFPTLRDGAQRFYLSLPNKNISLDEFFEKLRNRFGDKRGTASAILELSRNKFDEKNRRIRKEDLRSTIIPTTQQTECIRNQYFRNKVNSRKVKSKFQFQ